jgi:hypothetical protein
MVLAKQPKPCEGKKSDYVYFKNIDHKPFGIISAKIKKNAPRN